MSAVATRIWSARALPQLHKTSVQKTLINVVALLLLCLAASTQSDAFFTWSNWNNIGEQIAIVLIIGMPFTLLMVSGAFDLSVGSTMALTGTIAGLLSQHMAVGEAFVLATLVGLVVGAVNATLVVGMGINSFIATIGTLYVARGAALLLSGGQEVSSVPASYSDFGTKYLFGGLSVLIPISLAVVAAFIVIQRSTTLGLHTIAAGSSEEASFLSGVPIRRTRIVCFLLTGLAAGFAGVLQSSQLGLGSPTAAAGLEFEVIVAIVIGGTSLFGGEGRVGGTFLGALIVGVVSNGLNLAAVPSYWQTVSLGVILIAAVGIDRLVRNPHVIRTIKRMRERRALATRDGPPGSGLAPPGGPEGSRPLSAEGGG